MTGKTIAAVSAVLIFIFFSSDLIAQTETRESPEEFGGDIRFPALPYYSYGSGLGWTTPDSTFRLNLRFRMQSRATYLENDHEDAAIEAAVRRLRVRFDGFVGDPRFLYAIQLSFAPGDVGEIQEGGNINIIRDAVMFYQPNNNWSLGFGQTKLPGNRQRLNSSGALQLTDRTINNARFTIDRDFGFFAYYLNENTDRFSYNIKTAVSTGDGRNWTQNPDASPAYTGRLELFPFGVFQNNGMLFEGDIVREETPKLLLGGTLHQNKGAQRERGQLGSELFDRRDLTSVLLDAMLKYNGWALQSAYMKRSTDNPITVNPAGVDQFRYVFAGEGMDVQLSYLLPINLELIGRYSTQTPDSEIRHIYPQTNQYSAGLTHYVWEHAMKFQTEFTFNRDEFPDGSTQNGWYLRFQIEIGI
jgi:phosphate-selective porin OprO and OprP